MRFNPEYDVIDPEKLKSLCEEARHCLLVTGFGAERPRLGAFNPLFADGTCYVHLQRRDEQLEDLRRTPKALLSLFDFHTLIPSYWVDERYGGAATMYYRYAEWECAAELIEAPEAMAPWLSRMMERYQPEGRYDPIDPASPIYRDNLKRIVVVRLNLGPCRTKWKMGQNRDGAIRDNVRKQLLMKGDEKTAKEIQDG